MRYAFVQHMAQGTASLRGQLARVQGTASRALPPDARLACSGIQGRRGGCQPANDFFPPSNFLSGCLFSTIRSHVANKVGVFIHDCVGQLTDTYMGVFCFSECYSFGQLA